MKHTSLSIIMAILLLFSCSKEDISEEHPPQGYQLSEIEREFFEFNKTLGINSRDEKTYRITPEVRNLYQFVLEENDRNKFAEGINIKVGTPLWNHAYTFKIKNSDSYVLIPLYNEDLDYINGYLSGMHTSNKIILNGLTRKTLLTDLSTNNTIKNSALTVLAKQEKILFGNVSSEIKNALCLLGDEIITNGIQFEENELLNDGTNPCVPEIKEICIEQELGYHWFGGIENLPFHLDHDQDGTPNWEDQDWHERRFDLTQEEFTERIKNYWDDHYYDEYGDYYEFWSDFNWEIYDGGSDFYDDIFDFYDAFWDFWSTDYPPGWTGDNLYYDLPEIECPDWDPFQNINDTITTRSIECFSFYAWDCYNNPDYNWWSFYDGYDDDAVLLNRVKNYLDHALTGQVDFWTLYNIAQESDCDPLSSDFEQCLDWHFNSHRDAILEDMFEQVYPDYDFLPMVRWLAKGCELGGGTQAEYFSCISSQASIVISQFKISNPVIGEHLTDFQNNHQNIAAENHVLMQVYLMTHDSEYKELVIASFSMSGIMWTIAKEIIADKAVDILANIVGADEVRDAIKALNHRDWIEFSFEVTQLVLNNTPIGKFLKIAEAGSGIFILAKKIEKIWDKIETYADNVIESMWNIVKTYPKALRTNITIINSIAKTIKRGLKSIDEVMDEIPTFSQMSNARMKHILHGDATGGLHHASGLVNDPTKKVVEVIAPNSKGVYKVRYELPDGSTKLSTMFPDGKSEIGVAKAIESVFNNPNTDDLIENNTKRLLKGTDATGIPIEIVTDLNYNVITAYPIYN